MLIWTNSCHSGASKRLFLDRDGVVNMDRPDYIKSWDEFRFYPDSLKALRQCKEKGVGVILISNQSAINRGLISLQDFWDLHHRMIERIEAEGGELSAAFYCPHRPDEGCSCRKPSPGLIVEAARLLDISLQDSFMIGDRLTDLQAAFAAGCGGVLLERQSASRQTPDMFLASPATVKAFSNLAAAVAELY